jgi:hypothetical protein
LAFRKPEGVGNIMKIGGKVMRKILILSLCIAMSLLGAISAMADTVTLTSDYGHVPQYGGDYVGPAGATLNGTSIQGGITCLDSAHVSYFGSSWGVNVYTLADVASARFFSTFGVLRYEQAAWLNSQISANPGQVGVIQFAIWDTFNPGFSVDAGVISWLAKAQGINPSNYDFSSFIIYTPTGDYASNQEFMSGGASPVPLPPTVLLLGSGLLGLVALGWRRKKS